jgi:hypothetical protein
MPVSSTQGKDWLTERIVALAPRSVLDVGPGSGTYAKLLRPLLPESRWIGIEAWRPYVEKYDLRFWYHALIIDDVTFLDLLPRVDVVILGDVLEHLTHENALKLWARARAAARRGVFLSLPIVEYPQGPVGGNPFEIHRHTWSHQSVLAELPGITDTFSLPWQHDVGAYQAKGTAMTDLDLAPDAGGNTDEHDDGRDEDGRLPEPLDAAHYPVSEDGPGIERPGYPASQPAGTGPVISTPTDPTPDPREVETAEPEDDEPEDDEPEDDEPEPAPVGGMTTMPRRAFTSEG